MPSFWRICVASTGSSLVSMAQPLAQTGNIAETGRSLRKNGFSGIVLGQVSPGPLLAVSVRRAASGCSRERHPNRPWPVRFPAPGLPRRNGRFKGRKVTLDPGGAFGLDADCELGVDGRVGLDYKELPRDVRPGDVLLLDDGKIVFEVEKVVGNEVRCRVRHGGVLSNNKG